MQVQAQANAQASEQASLAEMQKQEALTQSKVQIEQAKSQFEIQRMQTEASIKRELMAQEFEYQMKLAEARIKAESLKEKEIEDRKDKRTRISGTQQSQLIDQRNNDTLPKDFENQGMEITGGNLNTPV